MTVPVQGRLAGIDYGHVRIGISVCDPSQSISSPLENYDRRGPEGDRQRFQQLVEEEELVGFVVGLPVHTDGRESEKSAEAREFSQWLTTVTGLPVAFQDERFSSKEAMRHLDDARLSKTRRKQRLDMIAAQIILASFLDSNRSEPPGSLDD